MDGNLQQMRKRGNVWEKKDNKEGDSSRSTEFEVLTLCRAQNERLASGFSCVHSFHSD